MWTRVQLIGATILLVLSTTAAAQPFVYAAAIRSRVDVFNAGNNLSDVAHIDLASNQAATDLALGTQDRRLYVTTRPTSGTAGGSLVVVDTLTNTIVNTVSFPQAAWAVTVSHDGQRIYVARDPATLTILRASDLVNIGNVPVGIEPADIAVMPDESALYVTNRQSANVSVVDLTTFTATTIAVGSRPLHVAIRPDGHEAFVSNSGSGTVSVIDTASRTVTTTVSVLQASQEQTGPVPSALVVSADGSKLYVGDAAMGNVGSVFAVRIMSVATRTFTESSLFIRAADAVLDSTAMRAYVLGSVGTHDVTEIRSLDTATDQATTVDAGLPTSGGGAIAIGNPAGCAFEITPKLAPFGPGGGSGSIDVPAPNGCSWTVAASATWLTPNATSGSGPATVTYTVGANGGEPRSATLTIAGQTVQVKQTLPQVWIDEPASGSTANQPVRLRGWTVDRDDSPTADRFGTGIDAIQVYAYPSTGGSPIFVGSPSAETRSDIAAIYGEKYSSAGYTMNVRGLAAGTYTLVVYAHSARTGSFTPASTTVTLTVTSTPVGVLDAPRANDEVTQPFMLAGWAADLARPSGTGVDAVNVYAYPASGGAPIFVGAAQYGVWPRPDVANFYGDSTLQPSGYLMLVSGLAIGRYTLVAYAHSTVTGQFFARTVDVNVIGSSEAIMQVDVAVPNSDRTVTMIGWAADRRASSGNGIAALQIWAYPDNGAAPVFLGSTGSPTIDRLEPRLLLGSQFGVSGWNFTSTAMSSGGYRVVVYALSAVTGQFDAVRVVRVVIP